MIELQDVTVCYDKARRTSVPSLDKVSLTIGAGELVFLVGPSGAGKSSLLKLLYAGIRPDLGRVVVDGQDISRLGPREVPGLRRKIGVVFQDFQLLTEKTAFENVAFALRVIGVPQNVINREVPRALETVGIAHRAHAFPHELSGGEQQRVAIARAIVNDPILLLADEPTGNLDPDTAAQIGDLLANINRDRGTTVVLVTHDQALVDTMQKRVVRLRDGHVVADDCPGYYHPEDAPGYVAPHDAARTVKELAAKVQLEPDSSSGPVPAPPSAPAPTSAPAPNPVSVAVPVTPSAPTTSTATVAPPRPAIAGVIPPPAAPPPAPRVENTDSVRTAAPAPETGDREPAVSNVLENTAPIGSPENPIVLYDR